jgi:hypothetical protein
MNAYRGGSGAAWMAGTRPAMTAKMSTGAAPP